ncbi:MULTISPECIES: glycoside hydrolase family 5 protein [Niastella]|uniref:Glycoside hydrolase family 5 protein n=1 Tax=Niastella soli TaxID=2821487 RepID=A0ABS3YY89_9BACT|nr:glycoside hydrolase family 5 protein [Niastella soli]MBO9202883.1 glycoside hydrolase family 5 protein [Niastella soli]
MKKIYTVILSIFIFMAGFAQIQPVKDNGALKVAGTKLVNQNWQPVVLRGMSLGWHNWWPRFYNAEVVSWLKNDWGCTIIRAAMGVEPDHGYIQEPAWSKEKIKAVIDAAIKEGIYVIVDWHSHNIRLEEAKQFFIEIATEYGKQPNIIYEIFNEPAEQSWADVKAYSLELLKTIRAIDPDNVILIGSPHWDQDVQVVADDPIKGYNNIMYTLHYYAASHKQNLRDRADYALKKNIPIFISESAGMEHTGDGPLNETEWKTWIAWAEKNQISWLTWSVTDKNETCSVLLPSASSTGNWRDEDLQPSGIMARHLILLNSKRIKR